MGKRVTGAGGVTGNGARCLCGVGVNVNANNCKSTNQTHACVRCRNAKPVHTN